MTLTLESGVHQWADLQLHVLGFSPLGNQRVSVYVNNYYYEDWYPVHESIERHHLVIPLEGPTTKIRLSFLFSEALALSWTDIQGCHRVERRLGMGLLGLDWVPYDVLRKYCLNDSHCEYVGS